MEKVVMINELYFEKKMSLTEISNIVNTSISYISKILRKDERYKIEKEKRVQENLKKRRNTQKILIYNNRKNKIDLAYINMKNQHEQATKELSKHSIIGNNALRKWSGSAYKYNSKKNRYEFDTNTLLKPADYPLYIKV